MGNDNTYKTMGIDTIKLKMYNEIIKILTDIRYVLVLKKNLISLEDFDSNGSFEDCSWCPCCFKGTHKGNLYYLDRENCYWESSCL